MRSIEEIVEEWVNECGINRSGKNGTYKIIPFQGKKDLLRHLIQTFIDEGYDEETVRSLTTRNKVVNACAPPDFANIDPKDSRKMKQITAQQWEGPPEKNRNGGIIKEFYHGTISKYVPEDKSKQYTVEPEQAEAKLSSIKTEFKELPLEPKDRIKIDTSGFVEPELDLDFLSELQLDPPKEDT